MRWELSAKNLRSLFSASCSPRAGPSRANWKSSRVDRTRDARKPVLGLRRRGPIPGHPPSRNICNSSQARLLHSTAMKRGMFARASGSGRRHVKREKWSCGGALRKGKRVPPRPGWAPYPCCPPGSAPCAWPQSEPRASRSSPNLRGAPRGLRRVSPVSRFPSE